jgi:hypothetical protein
MGKSTKRKVLGQPAPVSPSLGQLFISALGWVLFGVFAGQLMESLPVLTDICGLIATGTVLALSHTWHLIRGAWRGIAVAVASAVTIVCGYKGIREYTAADYSVEYRVCGTPMISYGYVVGVVFSVEWINPNDTTIWVHVAKRELSAEDRKSKLPVPDIAVEIPPTKTGQQSGKLDDHVDFDPPLTTKPLVGQAHYEFNYGPDKKHLRRTFVIDGVIDIPINEAGYQFRYSPTSESTPGFIGYCNERTHTDPIPE